MGAAENLKNLKPHRPAAEYKQMVKMQQEPGGGKANRSKGTDLLQEEEEPNFFVVLKSLKVMLNNTAKLPRQEEKN